MKQKINGILLLNKAVGISSNHALQEVKRLFNAQKAGHTGTLDPMASGLLPICFGEATKYSQLLLDSDKIYLTTLKFGESTSTGDKEGEVIFTSKVKFDQNTFSNICRQFLGPSQQMPPMFSALKYKGIPLYQYARNNIIIERKKRNIKIYKIEIIDFNFPFVTLKIHCSKGTYIRTLAEDIAKKLNSCAHLTSLTRIQTHQFNLENAYTFEKINNLPSNELYQLLLPTDCLVKHLEKIILNNFLIQEIKNGKLVHSSCNYEIMTPLSLYTELDQFIGLGTYIPELQAIKALRLMDTSS